MTIDTTVDMNGKTVETSSIQLRSPTIPARPRGTPRHTGYGDSRPWCTPSQGFETGALFSLFLSLLWLKVFPLETESIAPLF